MKAVNRLQIEQALDQIGIQPGDGLLVHSALHLLGKPTDGPATYYQAIRLVIELPGEAPERLSDLSGTLAVPTFNFAFAKGQGYDPAHTPSTNMGAFSEYVRGLAQARRTTHPMQSIAVIGKLADELAGCETASAFDPGSAFERMVESDFKILLLGADVQAVSLLHYCEQKVSVPYRYWKEFKGQVKTVQGWQEAVYRMYVRDLQLDPQLDLRPVQRRLEERGQWHQTTLNYGKVSAFQMVDFVQAGLELLRADPWALVANRPTR